MSNRVQLMVPSTPANGTQPPRKARPRSAPIGARRTVERTELPGHRVAELLSFSSSSFAEADGGSSHAKLQPASASIHGRAEQFRANDGTEGLEKRTEQVLSLLQGRAAARVGITRMYRAMDDDRHGHVSYAEFVGNMRKLGLRETDEELLALAKKIDVSGRGYIFLKDFATAMTAEELEDGLFSAQLKAALEVAEGKVPRPERPLTVSGVWRELAIPEPPAAVRGGIPRSSRCSSWGGAHPPANAEEAGPLAQLHVSEEARQAAEQAAGRRAVVRVEQKERLEVQKVLDLIRAHAEAQGSISAAFRKLETDKSGKIRCGDLEDDGVSCSLIRC